MLFICYYYVQYKAKEDLDMWIMDDKEGILSNNRILNDDLWNDSCSKLKKLLEKDVDEKEFYEAFVPFLKNLFTLIDCNTLEQKKYNKKIGESLNILNTVKNKTSVNNINNVIGEINAYLKSFINGNDFLRRKQSTKATMRKYLKNLVGKTGISNKTHAFMNDYNRIVYSSSFRRLQDKAQVFPLEKHDYARTRLTHSIEVSSIASQLGNITAIKLFLNNNQTKKNIAFQTEKILSCASLLHDIGNPPFGHFGEEAIKDFFKTYYDQLKINIYTNDNPQEITLKELCKNDKVKYNRLKTDFTLFDGNAQSFRIATKTQIYKPGHSLELTGAVLGAIIKYPFDSAFSYQNWDKAKFGYFYSEENEFNLLQEMGVACFNNRNPLVLLLEAADDICYVTSDLDDAIKKGILTYEIFNRELDKVVKPDKSILAFKEKFNVFFIANGEIAQNNVFELTMQRMINDLRIQLIGEVSEEFIKQNNEILKGINVIENDVDNNKLKYINSQKHCYELLKCIKSASLVDWLKDLFAKYVYNNNAIIKNELMGYEIICYLLQEFVDAVLKLDFKHGEINKEIAKRYAKQNRVFSLISPNFIQTFKKEVEKIDDNNILEQVYYRLRLVVDYISGMTDSYAKEIYQILNGF